MAIAARAALLGAVLVLHGCGGDDPVGTPGPNPTPTATALVFLASPSEAEGQVPFEAVRVGVVDADGNVLTGVTSTVSIALSEAPGGASLRGTTSVAAVDGVATFADLSVVQPGAGFVLTATSGTLEAAESDPFPVSLTFAEIHTGSGGVCGRTAAGYAYCWGLNRDDVWVGGQLGDGTTENRAVPTAVVGGRTFDAISVGHDHACGLTPDGALYCWGVNGSGQLGDGTKDDRMVPTAVSGGHEFTQVTAGGFQTCAVATGGAAWCWGHNELGVFGDGTRTSSTSPVPAGGPHLFTQLSTGNSHTCGITPGGDAYCWGRNGDGELGDGTTTERLDPVAVVSDETFVEIRVGIVHTCGVTDGGVVLCWGRHFNGSLGDGNPADVSRSTPEPVAGGLTFETVAVGGRNGCAVTPEHEAYCWGDNQTGVVGDGTTEERLVPTAVAGGHAFVAVATSGRHACGVTESGGAFCWGVNDVGQLGDGTLEDSLVPVRVRQ